MYVLDLFSGIGGFSLGLERAGMKTVAFCEIDPYCRKVLAKQWPGVKIHENIKQLDGSQYDGAVDLICGGYPCQPFSVAGKQQGEKDPRHLWPEMYRIIRPARPRWVVAENVRGHIRLGFDTVAAQLEDEGFTVWPFVIPACAVGAPHRRDRLWIVGHAPGERLHARSQTRVHCEAEGKGAWNAESQRRGEDVAHSSELHREWWGAWPGRGGGFASNVAEDDQRSRSSADGYWAVEPDVGRVAHGISARVDRLRALGNAVVPQIPELIGRTILAYEHQLAMAA